MNTHKKSDQETRNQILSLLSDDERARVSAGEDKVGLADGDEYIDLAAPDNGVRRVHMAMQLTLGKVLPRRAVSAATWAKISARFGTRFAPKAAT
jgi:hypothetical protein